MDAAQKAIRLFALIQMDEQRQQLRGFVRSNADRSALVRLSIGAANHHDHSAVSGGRKLSLQAYYALWQWRAVRVAHDLHVHQAFARVNHVTYAGLRAPSFMGTLGIPFIFGPVAGGERAPWKLRFGYGLTDIFSATLNEAGLSGSTAFLDLPINRLRVPRLST
jgi:hypothetical protein